MFLVKVNYKIKRTTEIQQCFHKMQGIEPLYPQLQANTNNYHFKMTATHHSKLSLLNTWILVVQQRVMIKQVHLQLNMDNNLQNSTFKPLTCISYNRDYAGNYRLALSGAPNDYHLCNTSQHSQILLQSTLGITMLISTSSIYKYHVFLQLVCQPADHFIFFTSQPTNIGLQFVQLSQLFSHLSSQPTIC